LDLKEVFLSQARTGAAEPVKITRFVPLYMEDKPIESREAALKVCPLSCCAKPIQPLNSFLLRLMVDTRHMIRNPHQVNNKRTPSGNFFQTSNPAIYMAEKPK
jgi:hypothetical protein